jgi:hypothetical protein
LLAQGCTFERLVQPTSADANAAWCERVLLLRMERLRYN